jgi:multicomponent K+:H+ antiporter subunit G
MRIHSASQGSSLGVICIIIATVLFFYAAGQGFAGRALLVFLFLYFTAALATHMIGKSFYYRHLKPASSDGSSKSDPPPHPSEENEASG